MTEPRTDQPPFRAIVAGVGAGLVLMLLGVFGSWLLVGLGGVVIVLVPVSFSIRQVRRHALYVPEQRHDASYVEYVARMIEREQPGRRRHERQDLDWIACRDIHHCDG